MLVNIVGLKCVSLLFSRHFIWMCGFVGKSGCRLRIAFDRAVVWMKCRISVRMVMALLAVAIGALSGFGAFLLKYTVGYISSCLTSGLNASGYNLFFLLLPVVGIILTGVYVRYVLKDNISHGVRRLMGDLSHNKYGLSGELMYAPMVASSLTLGFGGSAGSEGPIAYTGAAIGSNVGRWFGLQQRYIMILIGCGAGAGIAGIFKAPIGGMLFTLEVLGMELSTVSVLTLLLASSVSAFTAYVLSGCSPDMSFVTAEVLHIDFRMVMFMVLFGIVCGAYSLYYSFVMKMVEHIIDRVNNQWLKNVVSGGVIGVLIFAFPALYGEGYGVVEKVLNGDVGAVMSYGVFAGDSGHVWIVVAVLVGIVAVKCFATSMTNSGGGVAGDFAPTLFAGCMLGLLFAIVMNNVAGCRLPQSYFAYFGMAGVMSGVIRAPFLAIFLTSEMTGCGGCLMPLAVVAAVSFGVVRVFTLDSYYSRRLDRNNGLLTMQSRRV